MKTFAKILVATAVSVAALSANAAALTGQPYVGVKVGQVSTDVANSPKAVSYGVYGGYNFNQNFGAEVDFVGAEKEFEVNGQNYTLDAKTFGAYGTYRYNFADTPFSIKGKLGVAKTDADVKMAGNDNEFAKLDKVSPAGGVALGYAVNNSFGLEAGYDYLNKDAQGWSLGASLKF